VPALCLCWLTVLAAATGGLCGRDHVDIKHFAALTISRWHRVYEEAGARSLPRMARALPKKLIAALHSLRQTACGLAWATSGTAACWRRMLREQTLKALRQNAATLNGLRRVAAEDACGWWHSDAQVPGRQQNECRTGHGEQ